MQRETNQVGFVIFVSRSGEKDRGLHQMFCQAGDREKKYVKGSFKK